MNAVADFLSRSQPTPRRDFIKLTALAAATVSAPPPVGAAAPLRRPRAPREKLNLGLIGTGGRGMNMIRDFLQLNEEVIAFCDVDPKRLAGGVALATAAGKWSGARHYADYRKMFEAEPELDAVVVTTPDHMHAPISLLAMSQGLHVFCEKPLARTVGEARRMRAMARTSGVVTQMGTQGSASPALRRAVEIIRAGVLGDIREVHIWCDRTPALAKPGLAPGIPAGMNWDVWLGVNQPREFSSNLHPFAWRWWQAFGTGPLGDMGCHLTNVAFRSLDLFAPSEIDVSIGDVLRPGMFPHDTKIDYRFPERNGRKPLTLSWYDGGRMPERARLESHGIPQQFAKVAPTEKLIIGTKGVLYGDGYVKLQGEGRFLSIMKHAACLAVPETIERAKLQGTLGHYNEWIEACKGHGKTYAGFEVGAAQTEMVLLGAVAVQLGRSITWDPANLRVPGEPQADALLHPVYRPGFTVT